MQPRNYASHAIEAIESFLSARAQRNAGGDVLQVRSQEVVDWLRKGVKFMAPVNGEFLDRIDLLADGVDYPRLPFDVICLEYDYEVRDVSAKDGIYRAALDQQPDRACVLAFYPETSTPVGRIVSREYGTADAGEFIVWPVLGFKAGRTLYGQRMDQEQWMPLLDPVLVTRERRSPCSIEIRAVETGKRMAVQVLATEESMQVRAAASVEAGLEVSAEGLLKEMANDAAGEALAVVELCNLLECTNVTTDVVPAPAKLNRKRVAAGRPPLFEYRVLKLREASAPAHESGTGEHVSPRLHYRRGHIRRLQAGKKTWVRPHMVGDAMRGVILKDYEMSR